MATSHFPAYLTLMVRTDALGTGERAERALIPFPTAAAFTRDDLCDVAMRRGVLDRLELVAGIAPTAPLSFVVVKVYGLGQLNAECGRLAGDARCVQSQTNCAD